MKKAITKAVKWSPRVPGLFNLSLHAGLFMGLASFVMQDGPAKPDETRFTPVVLAEDLDEPMAFEVAKDGTAFIIERKGALKNMTRSQKRLIWSLRFP